MSAGNNIHIGTSGWYYDHWKGHFYPEKLAKKNYFQFYCEKFGTVEINNTFYQLPLATTFTKWSESTPDDFIFAIKASRYITHYKRLREPQSSLQVFLERISLLGPKLGPILFQLPPRWPADADRLAEFLEHFPRNLRCTFEFRDASWLNESIYEILSEYNAALCLYDFSGRDTQRVVTADFIYGRLHGPDGAYEGSYTEAELSSWADFFKEHVKKGHKIFCYFDNDQSAFAAHNALKLIELMQ